MAHPPLVVEYLRTHSIEDLFVEHGVKVAVGTRPYKASLNYGQIESRESDPLACECRGLVLSTPDGSPFPTSGVVGETIVLARAFDRFFNYGQGCAAPLRLDEPGTRVFEKLDGTLCIVYHDPFADEWCVATRSVPDADRPIDGFADHTFRSLFEHAVKEHLGLDWRTFTSYLLPSVTYCFELTTPRNRIVVDNRDYKVHLLAMRGRDGVELCPVAIPAHPFPVAPSYPTDNLEGLLGFVNSRAPTVSEGVVVRMSDFSRVKVKSLAYVAAQHARDSACASPRALLTVVLSGHDDDVFHLLPDHVREHGEQMREGLRAWMVATDANYERLSTKVAGDRKAMALAVQREKLPMAPYMSRFIGQVDSARAWIDRARGPKGWPDGFLDNLAAMIAAAKE